MAKKNKVIEIKATGFEHEGIKFLYNNFSDASAGLYVKNDRVGKVGKKSNFITKSKISCVDSVVLDSSGPSSVVLKVKSLSEWKKYIKHIEDRIELMKKMDKARAKKKLPNLGNVVISHPTSDLTIVLLDYKK